MKPRTWFPLDLAALLFPPVIISLLVGSLFPTINLLRHPTGLTWLWTFGIATGAALLGTVLLFVAKLPQYRTGIFLRLGARHLPPREQRLYRVSFWLIVPSVLVLVALLFASHRFH